MAFNRNISDFKDLISERNYLNALAHVTFKMKKFREENGIHPNAVEIREIIHALIKGSGSRYKVDIEMGLDGYLE